MASNRNVPNPVRTLLTLFGVLAILTAVMFMQGSTVPKLGLDLAGGTTITMKAETEAGKKPPKEQMDQAVKIIHDRVDGTGLADATVTKQGDDVVVVSVPGDENDQEKIQNLIGTTAQLQFRQVLVAEPGTPAASPLPTATGTPAPTKTPAAKPSASPSATAKNRALSQAFTPSPGASKTPKATKTPTAPAQDPAQAPTSDFGKVKDAAVIKLFNETVCEPAPGKKVEGASDAKKPYVVACENDGSWKYILGPVRVQGTEISEANSSAPNMQQNETGWSVALKFKNQGGEQFGAVTKEASAAYGLNQNSPESQVAIVLDGQVVSAPQIRNGPILNGTASISGGSDFDQAYAENLAQVLKYGALPLQFPEGDRTSESISSTLGADQLRGGLLAGGIGLALVVLYCLFYYRALGFVAVASLGIASAITYLAVVILGENAGFRLTLPHIIGLIVSIGITADSFIVYFERLRDELRAGRPLRPSVEVAWQRARRTILVADAVTIIAAVVLYVLAVGGIKGFAFAMGLTTLIDIIVVFFFTKPLVALLARLEFFARGHKLSGLDSHRLTKTTPVARLKRQEA